MNWLAYAPAWAGQQYTILKFEKNENPENILIVYTELDKNCYLLADSQKSDLPVLDFYWLMNGTTFKKTHSLIKASIRRRLYVDPDFRLEKNQNSFPVVLNELATLNDNFKNARLIVKSEKKDNQCRVSAQLDSSNGEWKNYNIIKIYTETKKTFLPPFRKVISIQIEGLDSRTASSKVQTYSVK